MIYFKSFVVELRHEIVELLHQIV